VASPPPRGRTGPRRRRQETADGQPDQAAGEHGDLLRAVPAGVLLPAEAVVHERAMCGRHDVHADVGNRARKRQDEKGGAVTGGCRREPTGGEQGTAEDERPAAILRHAPPVAPAAHEQRHCEAGGRVHHHHRADQRGRLPDVRKQQRQVRRRHRPNEPSPDGGDGKHGQVREASTPNQRPRHTRQLRHATTGSDRG
jgi:hypothetical protein